MIEIVIGLTPALIKPTHECMSWWFLLRRRIGQSIYGFLSTAISIFNQHAYGYPICRMAKGRVRVGKPYCLQVVLGHF